MRKKYLLNSYFILFILFISVNFFSCSSTKKIKYFQDIPDSGILKTIPPAAYVYPKIQVGDILNINIQTLDPLATQPINLGNSVSSQVSPSAASVLGGAGGGGAGAGLSSLSQQGANTGYQVDEKGDIDVPVLGKIAAIGHTTAELKGIITDTANKYYKNPVVTVRFVNFNVSITGEVLKPGVYTMPTEKVSIINAIAMAGDLTIFGKRENVLLIRENPDGTKSAYRINLKKSDILSSPLYYMHQNDIVYIEPRKAKSDATDAAQQKYIAIGTAVLSLLIILAYRVK